MPLMYLVRFLCSTGSYPHSTLASTCTPSSNETPPDGSSSGSGFLRAASRRISAKDGSLILARYVQKTGSQDEDLNGMWMQSIGMMCPCRCFGAIDVDLTVLYLKFFEALPLAYLLFCFVLLCGGYSCAIFDVETPRTTSRSRIWCFACVVSACLLGVPLTIGGFRLCEQSNFRYIGMNDQLQNGCIELARRKI